MKLLFLLHSSVKLNHISYNKDHTVNILSVCDVKGCGTALNFACQEQKVHLIDCNEKEDIIDAIDE